jgi:hypothetical protein
LEYAPPGVPKRGRNESSPTTATDTEHTVSIADFLKNAIREDGKPFENQTNLREGRAQPLTAKVLTPSGYRPMGDDPNFPAPEQAAAMQIRSPYVQGEGAQPGSEQLPLLEARENTSPEFPPVPQQGASAMKGIETARASDNLPG